MKRVTAFVKKALKKLRERSGETIVETLVSMLIVVMSFTMLAGAIVAAARVNAGAEKQILYLNEADSAGPPIAKVTITTPGGSWEASTVSVKKYDKPGQTPGTLYYYD